MKLFFTSFLLEEFVFPSWIYGNGCSLMASITSLQCLLQVHTSPTQAPQGEATYSIFTVLSEHISLADPAHQEESSNLGLCSVLAAGEVMNPSLTPLQPLKQPSQAMVPLLQPFFPLQLMFLLQPFSIPREPSPSLPLSKITTLLSFPLPHPYHLSQLWVFSLTITGDARG